MVVPANPPPVGCYVGWPIRSTAASGVQIVYGAPHSRQPPGVQKLRGIGIKMRKDNVPVDPQYPDHDSTWAGLYEQKLHELFFPFFFPHSRPGSSQPSEMMVLHLPMMGMPPREPSENLMQEVRTGVKFTSWFTWATVVKATEFDTSMIKMSGTKGDDVVIALPLWPKSPSPTNPVPHTLYSRTESAVGFEFRTALPDSDSGHNSANIKAENLYFIQLLPNELPSYHFWAAPGDNLARPRNTPGVRIQLDGPGSPHHADWHASNKQGLRHRVPSPTASRTATTPAPGGSTTATPRTMAPVNATPPLSVLGKRPLSPSTLGGSVPKKVRTRTRSKRVHNVKSRSRK